MSFTDDAVRGGKRFVKRRLAAPVVDACWALYGKKLKNPEVRGRTASFLFLCKGNICRSPFAERIARKMAGERGLRDVEVFSAGFDVSLSLPPPAEAVQAARSFGVILDEHRSTPLTEEMIRYSDAIIVMEAAHLVRLRRAYPSRRDYFYLLPLFRDGSEAGEGNYHRYNIGDPFGGELDRFLACYGRIARCVERLLAGIAGDDGRG